MLILPITTALILSLLFSLLHAQAPRPNGRGHLLFDPVNPDTIIFRIRRNKNCTNLIYRSLSGTCSSKTDQLWGSSSRPHYSYFRNHSSKVPNGRSLPSARFISNVLCTQTAPIYEARRLNHLAVIFGQFIDHNLVATPAEAANMPIHIPQDDPIRALFPSGSLPFRRSRRALVRKSRERPLNSLSSALDLSAVYGVDERRNMALRTLKDGKMRVSKGDMLPYNRRGFVNSPSGNKAFFLAGDHRANEHPVLTSIHTLFVREHNSICDDLRLVSKKWNDEDMFQFARVINVAQFQKIVFNEFYPAFVGSPLPPYTGYKRRMNPTVSNVFSTAAFRVGHTMVSDVIYRHPKNRDPLRPLSLKDSFFKSHVVLKKDIDQFIRGAAHQRAQEIDLNVTSALRNFLFRRVRHETGFDLVALNLQRSRDHALVSYARIRKRLQYPEVKTWSDISSDLAIQAELKRVYGLARTVEAWIGLIAEDKVKGSSFGKTMGAIWRMEFVRLRNGDYFYYRRAGAVPKEIRGISRMKRVFRSRALLKDIILRNTNITRRELPVGTNSIFFA